MSNIMQRKKLSFSLSGRTNPAMRRILVFGGGLACLALLAPSGFAQPASRAYVSMELGGNFASGWDMIGEANDRPSVCDEFINPMYASVPGCTGPRGMDDVWEAAFDGARGLTTSIAVGYAAHPLLRLEAEYLFRTSNYSQQSPVQSSAGINVAKLGDELEFAAERLGIVTASHVLVNAYIDIPAGNNRYRPYIGGGIGFAFTKAVYGSVWARNPDPAAIKTGRDLPNAEQIARTLAGTVSVGETTLEDAHLSYQIVAGADYAVSEHVTLGLKARTVFYGSFSGGAHWDPLRSHAPDLRRDGSEPVEATMSTEGIYAAGMSIVMKYRFR